MPATMSRGLGTIVSQARGLSSFSRHSFAVSNELRRAAIRNPTTSTPCPRALSTTTPSPTPLSTSLNTSKQPHSRHLSTSPKLQQKDDVAEEPYFNPHKAKRHWPPDMSKLSEKQQFRMERKYRRRAKLKWARPRWMKATKLAQWGAIAFTIVYAVLFLEWDENDRRGNPFADVRKYFFDSMNSVFTRRTGQDPRKPVDSSSTES